MSLADVADRQAVWSATANGLKATLDPARTWSFLLSIGGALAAAVATTEVAAAYREPLTGFGAFALAAAAFISARLLSKESLSRHVRARAASEALKREAYLRATATAPYDDPDTADGLLSKTQNEIEGAVLDLLSHERRAQGEGSCPREILTRAEYEEQRVEGQIAWYRRKADGYAGTSRVLHAAEWLFAFAAATLTALAGILGKGSFDIASLTAVLTTAGGAILAHLQATRYDEMIDAYRATAWRLERHRQTAAQDGQAATLAGPCEKVIENETRSWSAMWTKGS